MSITKSMTTVIVTVGKEGNMGCFDELQVRCPKCCEGKLAWQSKADLCRQRVYSLANVPPKIAGDLDGSTAGCDVCDFLGVLRVQTLVHVE
jgi:hypothetical protein